MVGQWPLKPLILVRIQASQHMNDRQEIIPYEEVFRALNIAKINYVVCGGAAVVLFGFARLTIGLDLIVGLDEVNLERLYEVLKQLNYQPSIPIKKEEFVRKEKLRRLAIEKNMKVVSFHNLEDPFKVIDIGVNLPQVSEILKSKKYIKVDNLNIPTISINNLIKMKENLGRKQDLIDVENLKRIKEQKR